MDSPPVEEKQQIHTKDVENNSRGGGHAAKMRGSISSPPGDSDSIEGQLFSMNDLDPALDAKMRLINMTIDEIGWTNLQLKLFFLNGFGYCADSLILVLQSIIAGQAAKEFHPSFPRSLTFAAYAGMLVGALFWGFSADVIGRRFAFNTSLFVSAIAAIIAGASPNWIFLAAFVALAAFGSGGNLVLDTTVFLEFLPSNKQYLVTTLSCWWGLAPVIAAAFAWPLLSLPQYYCASAATCTKASNMGWRYIWYGNGALVLFMSIARITVIRLHETPKFLVGQGKDAEIVAFFQDLAKKYNRPCSLTLEQMTACGVVASANKTSSKYSLGEVGVHIRGLFATKKLGISTSLIWFSWVLIGLAYPLFYVFLPEYLASRGADLGENTPYYVWRDYFITNSVSIFSPFIAGAMCASPLGRRYTMVIGALLSMAFFFGYTAIRTANENVAMTSMIYFMVNIYYGTLYAYTPEVLPSAHRATGNGIAVACNRVMGLVSAAVATAGNTATSVPIFICAALYIVMAIVAFLMPFEPYGRKSM